MPGGAAGCGERGQQILDALLPFEPAEIEQQRRAGRAVDLAGVGDLVGRHLPAAFLDAVVDHRDVVGLDLEEVRDLAAHGLRAGDHGVGAVGQPPLDRVNLLVQRVRQPAGVPAGLGGVDGADQRHPRGLGNRDGRVRDQPVVRVDDVRLPAPQQVLRGADHGMPHGEGPGDEVAFEGHVHRVFGHPDDPHALDDAVAARVRPGVGPGGVPAQDDDLVTLSGQVTGERVHVPGQAADGHWRVLPGQHQHTHGQRLLASRKSPAAVHRTPSPVTSITGSWPRLCHHRPG